MNLLVTFVIAVVATALLLPGYRTYTLSEHGKLARVALEDVVEYWQSWQLTHPSQRPASLQSLGYAAPALYVSSDGTVLPSGTISSIYRISLIAPSAPSAASCGLVPDDARTGFVLVAQPVQMQRIETVCGRLCLSSSGQRGSSGRATVAECWGRPQGGANQVPAGTAAAALP